MVRDPGACRDSDKITGSTGSTGDSNRDRCAAGRARDADSATSTDEDARCGKGNYTGGGRRDGRGCEEWCARVHRGICDRRDARGRLRDDAAQGIGGSAGGDG